MKMNQISKPETFCKCCDNTAYLYDVVDFNKNCNSSMKYSLSGIPVYYYKCTNCDFIFSNSFDSFTNNDFEHYIYNKDYILVDPEYAEIRPRNNADVIIDLLSKYKNLEFLDYGGGNGLLAKHLLNAGFNSVITYDPFNFLHIKNLIKNLTVYFLLKSSSILETLKKHFRIFFL